MHKLIPGLILLLFLAFFSFSLAQEDSSLAIAIPDLTAVKCDNDTVAAVSEILRTEIGSTGAFNVIERAQLDKVMTEQKFSSSELVDAKNAVKIGNLVGAKYVMVGSISCLGTTYTISARVINVETSEMTLGKALTCDNAGGLPEICKQLAKDLAGLLADPKVAVMDFMNAIKAGATDKSWDLLSKARRDDFEEKAERAEMNSKKGGFGIVEINCKDYWSANTDCSFGSYWSKNFGDVVFGETPEKAEKGKKPNVAIGEATVDGSKASVKVRIGDKPEVTVFLVNEGGWKIDSPITFTK
jgi:hypothetical protein